MVDEMKKASAVPPTVRLNGIAYSVDLGQRLFKEAMNPSQYVDFDSAAGRRLCRQAGIVTCLACGASVMVSQTLDVYGLGCIRCGGRLRC